MANYAMIGERSGRYITWGGRVVTHENRAELEFLFSGVRVVPVDVPPSEEIGVRFLPGMEPVTFPLRREDFH